jgi:hypothetical protein
MQPNPPGAALPVRPRWTDWRGMALVAAFSILPVLGQFAAPIQTLDESLLLVYPEQMLAGRAPHRDFFTVYGPGGFGLLAAVYSLLGPGVIVERGVGLLYHVAIATGVVQLTSSFGRRASRAAGVTSALLLFPLDLTAYAWLGGLALTVWSLALLIRPGEPRSAFVAGVLGGLAPAWRFEMVVLLAASGPLIWRTNLRRPYLAGLAVGLTPTVLFLATSGRQVLDNVIVSRMAVNAQLRLETVPSLVWAGVAVSLLTTVALVIAAARGSAPRRVMISFAALCVLLLPQEMQRIDLPHVIFALCVIAPLGVACVLGPGKDLEAGPLRGGLVVLTFVLLSLLTVSAANALRDPGTTELTHSGRSIVVSQTDETELKGLLRAITETVPPGSRIFVGATDMSVPTLSRIELYHLLPEYQAGSYYLELPPGVAEKGGSPLLDDVLKADALILTDVPRQLRESLFPHMGRGVETVNRAVDQYFCPQRTIADTTIYVRCDSALPRPGLPQ